MKSGLFLIFCILFLQACGLNYSQPKVVSGNSVGLEIAGNPTSIDVNEGSALVIVPTLTKVHASDVEIRLSVTSSRNDVGTYFSDTFPMVVTIPAGSSSATINLNTVHNGAYTGDLPFSVIVSSPQLSGSVSLNLLLKDLEPLTLGSFTVSGVVDSLESTDTTADDLLVDSLTPKVEWDASAFAASYDVSILEDDGTTVKCPVQNTTALEYAFSSSTCSLSVGSYYRASVTAKNGATTLTAALFRFQVQSTAALAGDTIIVAYNGSAVTFDPRVNDVDGSSTITSVSTPASGTTSYTSNTVTFTPDGTKSGIETFTYTATDSDGETLSGLVTVKLMRPYTWTGAVSDNFSVAGNWCGNVLNPGPAGSCEGATTAPDNTQLVVVDLTCSSSHCNPVISSNVSVRGLILQANTLSKTGTATLTVGNGGFLQEGGSFNGGAGNVSVNDGTFTITGGTFTAPSGDLRFFKQNVRIASGVTFNHNGGTVKLDTDWTEDINIDAPTAVFNNVSMNDANDSFRATITGTLNVDGNLTLRHTSGYDTIDGGSIKLKGNLTSLDNGLEGSTVIELIGNPLGQTITADVAARIPGITIDTGTYNVTMSGTPQILNHFLIESVGTFVPSADMIFDAGTYDWGSDGFQVKLGGRYLPSVNFFGDAPLFDFLGETLNVGNLTLESDMSYTAKTSVLNNGTVNVHGDLLLRYVGYEGTATIVMKGNSSGQRISTTAANPYLSRFIIDAGAHAVVFDGVNSFTVLNNYEFLTAGAFTPPTNFQLGIDECYGDLTANMGSVNYTNVVMDPYCREIYLTDSVYINGDLTFIGGYGRGSIHMPNPGTGYTLSVGGVFTRNGIILHDYGATVPP